MSVIVKGMEMPKNCKSCPLRYSSTGYAWCDITGESLALEIDMRDYTCPLVDIPAPHGRLGDLDALIKDLAVYRGGHNEGYGFDGGMYEAYNNSIELVEDAPTVIEAEGETDGR